MVFSSLTFLYLFLPLAVIPYFLWNNRTYRNGLLLVLSLLFYSWGGTKVCAAYDCRHSGGLFRGAGYGGPGRAAPHQNGWFFGAPCAWCF